MKYTKKHIYKDKKETNEKTKRFENTKTILAVSYQPL